MRCTFVFLVFMSMYVLFVYLNESVVITFCIADIRVLPDTRRATVGECTTNSRFSVWFLFTCLHTTQRRVHTTHNTCNTLFLLFSTPFTQHNRNDAFPTYYSLFYCFDAQHTMPVRFRADFNHLITDHAELWNQSSRGVCESKERRQ